MCIWKTQKNDRLLTKAIHEWHHVMHEEMLDAITSTCEELARHVDHSQARTVVQSQRTACRIHASHLAGAFDDFVAGVGRAAGIRGQLQRGNCKVSSRIMRNTFRFIANHTQRQSSLNVVCCRVVVRRKRKSATIFFDMLREHMTDETLQKNLEREARTQSLIQQDMLQRVAIQV